MAQVKHEGYDWIIASLPRSGTHMLGFALDSHPDLQCVGEPGSPRYQDRWSHSGRLRGAIIMQPFLEQHLDTPRIIALVRPLPDLLDAASRHDAPLHVFEPGQVAKAKPVRDATIRRLTRQWVALIDALSALPRDQVLWLDYQQLTGGHDIRVLPDSKRVQQFLGVEPRVLTVPTYKPRKC